MPCSDGYGPGGVSYIEDPATKRRLDLATRVACTAMQSMSGAQLRALDPEAQRWWAEHQAQDRLRGQRERAREKQRNLKKAALSKLTKEERQVLGI